MWSRGSRLAFAVAVALAWLPATGAARAAPAADDWQVVRSPFDRRVVERYLAALRRRPDDDATLRRLVALYRRHRSVDELDRELVARAHRGDAVDHLLAARVARLRGDAVATVSRLRAALAAAGAAPPSTDTHAGGAAGGQHRGDGASPRDRAAGGVSVAELEVELARALVATGAAAEARSLLDAAAARLAPARRAAALDDLARLELDAGDADAALRHHREAAALRPPSVDAERRFAELLAAQRHPREALALWRALEPRLAGDAPRRVEALIRIGELLGEMRDDAAARVALRTALALVGPRDPARDAIEQRLVSVYRREGRLRELLDELSRRPGVRSAAAEARIADVAEEVGELDRAVAACRRALALDGRAVAVRQHLIALLDRQGRAAEALDESRRLAAAAPGDTRFRLALAERLARAGAGGLAEARALAARLATRSPRDPSLRAALADLYRRWGDLASAARQQEALVRLEPGDADHLVELGELAWQRGDRERARATWRRLEATTRDRPGGLARHAAVLLDHELPGEALELYQRALRLRPGALDLQRGLALALERNHRVDEAERLWLDLYAAAGAPSERPLRAEAGAHAIELAHDAGRLAGRAAEVRRRFDGGDDTFGPWLGDAYLRLGRADDSEHVLATLAARATTPERRAEALVGLAHVLVERQRPAEAIARLEEAARIAPSLGREIYPQMAALSLGVHGGPDALGLARRASALAPDDAQAEARVAELLERRGDETGALASYRRALAIDPRRHRTALALGALLVRRGEVAEALRVHLAAAATAADEDVALEAGRRALDLAEATARLADVEPELAALASAHRHAGAYRRLLVDLFTREVAAVRAGGGAATESDLSAREVAAVRAGGGAATDGDLSAREAGAVREHGAAATDGEAIRDSLRRIGDRALAPLLDALGDADPAETAGERRAAARLLGELAHPGAAGLLLGIAARTPASIGAGARAADGVDVELRVATTLAAGAVAGPSHVGALARLAVDDEAQVRAAAVDALGRLRARRPSLRVDEEAHGRAATRRAGAAAGDPAARVHEESPGRPDTIAALDRSRAPERAVRVDEEALDRAGATRAPSRAREVWASRVDEVLLAALADDSEGVRAVAAIAFARGGAVPSAARERLRAWLVGAAPAHTTTGTAATATPVGAAALASAAATALGAARDVAATGALAAVVERGPEEAGAVAAWALGRIGGETARRALLHATIVAPARTAAAAIAALGRLEAQAVAAAPGAAADARKVGAGRAVGALGEDALPSLVETDDGVDVGATLAAVARSACRRPGPVVLHAAGADVEALAAAIASALEGDTSPSVDRALALLLAAPGAPVRLEAGLREALAPRVAAPLAALATATASAARRDGALRALASLAAPAARAAIDRLATHTSPSVRAAAARAREHLSPP